MEDDDLLAIAYLKKDKRGNLWVVLECPFCADRHTHGAGKPDGEPLSFLGYREPHCLDKGESKQYRLVAAGLLQD